MSAYFMAQPERWEGLKKALALFGDRSTLNVERIEELLAPRGLSRDLANFTVYHYDLEKDEALNVAVGALYEKLRKGAASTHQAISAYLRRHPEQFAVFED